MKTALMVIICLAAGAVGGFMFAQNETGRVKLELKSLRAQMTEKISGLEKQVTEAAKAADAKMAEGVKAANAKMAEGVKAANAKLGKQVSELEAALAKSKKDAESAMSELSTAKNDVGEKTKMIDELKAKISQLESAARGTPPPPGQPSPPQ